MDFLPTLLQAIAYVPTLVSSIEGLFSHRAGEEKKRRCVVIPAGSPVHERRGSQSTDR